MTKLVSMCALAALAFVPIAARSATCTYGEPPATGASSSVTITATEGNAPGTFAYRTTGTACDATSYFVYAPKTKTWSSPIAFPDGSYDIESTTSTGAKAAWTGVYDRAGFAKPMVIRDTFTLTGTFRKS